MEDRRLADRARLRRTRAEGRHRQARRWCTRCARLAARDRRGDGTGGEALPRSGFGEHRFPAAADGFPRRRAGRGCALAGHADCRPQRAAARARRRQFPAQGPPARRPATAAGGQARRPGVDAALGRRRLARQPRPFVRRRAVAAAAGARGNRRRCGAGRRQDGACRRWPASRPPPPARSSRQACSPANARRSCSATMPNSIRRRRS